MATRSTHRRPAMTFAEVVRNEGLRPAVGELFADMGAPDTALDGWTVRPGGPKVEVDHDARTVWLPASGVSDRERRAGVMLAAERIAERRGA